MTDHNHGDPTFPPLMTGLGISAPDDVLAYAVNGVQQGKLEAGHVVWARNTSVMDWAIVLEPDVPLEQAMQMAPLAMVAAGDCIGVLTPPQVGLTFFWPDTILVNGGTAGGLEVVASTNDPTVVPDWLILRIQIRLKRDNRLEPGERPDITSLDEEGCPDLTRTSMIESYSRHFLTWLNTWNDDGFHPIHSAWLYRAHGLKDNFSISVSDEEINGTFTGLDEDGNILVTDADGTTRVITLAGALLNAARPDA